MDRVSEQGAVDIFSPEYRTFTGMQNAVKIRSTGGAGKELPAVYDAFPVCETTQERAAAVKRLLELLGKSFEHRPSASDDKSVSFKGERADKTGREIPDAVYKDDIDKILAYFELS